MKNDNIGNSDLEKILKNKMNELSDSVDCFDKISARAFPEKDPDFSESGFTVSDVENVTGRTRKPIILKWAALAAAAVLCIVFIPRSGIVRRVFSDLGGSVKKDYRDIITEINEETEVHEYRQLDVPLDYYLQNDVLVTPLFSCPFEDCHKDDVNVRIYIRQIGAGQYDDGFDMAQVYAVEYSGEYSEDSIIAAAKSAYSFTDEDIDRIDFSSDSEGTVSRTNSAVGTLFAPEKDIRYLQNSDGEPVSLACESYGCYVKNGDKTVYSSTSVLYGHTGLDSSDDYFYDIITTFGGEILELPDRQDMWAESVYFNGNPAFPKEETSRFTLTGLFPRESLSWSYTNNFTLIYPFDSYRMLGSYDETGKELTISNSSDNALISTIAVPFDKTLMRGTSVYFALAPFSGRNTETLERPKASLSYDGKHFYDIEYDEYVYNAEQSDIEEKLRKSAEQVSELAREIEKENDEAKLMEIEAELDAYKQKLEQTLEKTEAETTRQLLTEEIERLNAYISEIEKCMEQNK